ncbi:MAG: terpene cyclase/mutase family protein [Deltaproteobacteria bacterium]|nr:terpene cyclase/mutase family protein [Deltaproteobacteria bacterium]
MQNCKYGIVLVNLRKNITVFLIFVIGSVVPFLLDNLILHGYASTLEEAIIFIEENQNADGGWGYWPGNESYTEPTGLCLLALKCSGSKNGVKNGLEYLKKCQLDSGGVGINEEDKEGNWMSYAVLLAFHGLGASMEEERLEKWIFGFYDGYNNIAPDIVASMYKEFGYDMTIDGWPWFGSGSDE